jgi:hypothetical protein
MGRLEVDEFAQERIVLRVTNRRGVEDVVVAVGLGDLLA